MHITPSARYMLRQTINAQMRMPFHTRFGLMASTVGHARYTLLPSLDTKQTNEKTPVAQTQPSTSRKHAQVKNTPLFLLPSLITSNSMDATSCS